jgi:hypothetical protein
MPSQVELNFRAARGGMTQNAKLAAYFRAHPNRWLPMPELAKVITPTGIGAAVHSRVADCRKKFEMTILHRGGKHPESGLATSEYFYRLQGPETGAAEGLQSPGNLL